MSSANSVLNKEMFEAVLAELAKSSRNPSVRAVQEVAHQLYGIKPSFTTLSKFLQERDNLTYSSLDQIKSNSSLGAEADLYRVAELEALLSAEKAISQERLAIINALNEDLKSLQQRHVSEFTSIVKSFIDQISLMRDQFEKDLALLRLDRNQMAEQWNGLRAFLYEETDKARNSERGKSDRLMKRIDDLEVRNTALGQTQNRLLEKVAYYKGRYESDLFKDDEEREPISEFDPED